MTGMNFNSKVPRELQRRIGGVNKHDAFHSHAYAKEDPNGQRLGSGASPTSFEDRIRQEFSRQYVNQYRHSRIGVPTEHAREHLQGRDKPSQVAQSKDKKEMGGIKSKFNAASKPMPGVSGRPNASFAEPRGRSFNPYS